MILTAHQPVYLPWLGLFHKIALADSFVSFNQVQYQSKDWNNRNKIKTPQGALWLSVPVKKKGRLERLYTDIEIDNETPWSRKHWGSLKGAYSKSRHFKKYADFFEDTYNNREFRTLVELNEYMLEWFIDQLGIKVKTTTMDKHCFSGKKSGLVLDMCQKMGANHYIFGEQGRDYANIDEFKASGVVPHFQSYSHPTYPQLHGPFISHLSIVDLLFNHGEDSLDILMSGNIDRSQLLQDIQA
ncbi:WbqC family protein [Roseospirillum parvum]|uniref:WbqC-like protein family protein n=1 Tax=Roseospirillum parvum TaxID=83401 RepID=A0A1G8A2M8_9PROT|nr:WbqC family protein [Roseospirillum parvum]SDH15097.1 WbqC-like protein family protein [Roseospirillum parvum]